MRGPRALLRMRVFGAGPGATRAGTYEVRILRNGAEEVAAAEVPNDAFRFSYTATRGGRCTIEIARLTAPEKIELLSAWLPSTPVALPFSRGAPTASVFPSALKATE